MQSFIGHQAALTSFAEPVMRNALHFLTVPSLAARASLLAAVLVLAACEGSVVEPELQPVDEFDYALVLFGEAGMAMEGVFGAQPPRPFDGRTAGLARLPDELKLTQAQSAAIAALRNQFRDAHASQLASLRTTLERARAAREAGDSMAEVRAIRMDAMRIARSLQPAVRALHAAILRDVLTAEQREWLRANPPKKGGPAGG
jgi:Spy/CpxP family protein refolding chaperone